MNTKITKDTAEYNYKLGQLDKEKEMLDDEIKWLQIMKARLTFHKCEKCNENIEERLKNLRKKQ